MIVFTTIRNLPIDILEYKGIKQVVSYNLSSYYSDIESLNNLIPSTEYIPEGVLSGDCSTPEFDISYSNFIFSNDISFMEFMSIVIPAYTSPETLVQVLIRRSSYCDAITESLLKLIQQRYGYNAYIVNELEDFLYVEESDFSIPGLFTIDQDLERWRSMMPPDKGDIYD